MRNTWEDAPLAIGTRVTLKNTSPSTGYRIVAASLVDYGSDHRIPCYTVQRGSSYFSVIAENVEPATVTVDRAAFVRLRAALGALDDLRADRANYWEPRREDSEMLPEVEDTERELQAEVAHFAALVEERC